MAKEEESPTGRVRESPAGSMVAAATGDIGKAKLGTVAQRETRATPTWQTWRPSARPRRQATADRAAQLRERASSGTNSDSGDALPPPASEADIEEARQIVQKAQREAAEREKMKAKAKTASRDDLQAMINARLAMGQKSS
mmetsp:Transcript_107225/g.334243  ORF Transcript_107225/g.334243 Transcript_107225/m.334243 type:complete len:141 (+) Transcript_107225:246-668(+)